MVEEIEQQIQFLMQTYNSTCTDYSILEKQKIIDIFNGIHVEGMDNVKGIYFCSVVIDYDMAQKHFEYAIRDGSIKALNNLAELYNIRGNTEKAIECYEKAIENNCLEAVYNLGLLYSHNCQYEKGIKLYYEAISKGMEDRFNLLNCYSKIDEDKIKTIDKIIKLSRHNISVLEVEKS